MTYATWEEAARAQGWKLASECPGPDVDAALRNDTLDRDWDEVDWQAAAEDAGVDGTEVEEENERAAEAYFAGDRDFTPPYEP